MTPAQTAALLAGANQLDPRVEITEETVTMWHHLIGDLDPHACAQAITTHYRRNTTRVMPADVRALTRPNPTAPPTQHGLTRMPPDWAENTRKALKKQ